MRIAVVPGPGQSGLLRELAEDGSRAGAVVAEDNLESAVAERERDGAVRWVWHQASAVYGRLLSAGVRVARCHDVALADALLQGRDAASGAARAGRPQDDAGRALALLRAARSGSPGGQDQAQAALFDPEQAGAPGQADPRDVMDALTQVHASQLAGIAADEKPAAFAMLVSAESAGALAAAEMTRAGLPWSAEVHDKLLTDLLGPRPALPGQRPPRLAELAAQVSAAFGTRQPVNPDSPGQLLRALAGAGIRLPSTRLAVLSGVDHPAIAPLTEYKELSRLHSAFGWSWLDTWVTGGRFRPEFVVGGVVSGRWASRGGGALQIPRLLRRAVVADPGQVLVVADAAQLEPRVLAALAGDQAFAAAAAGGDLYAELASAFGGDRAKAKVAMLSAMYGGAGGETGQLLAVLRRRFPAASDYVEAAARAGEEGRVVRSVLGRTCPPPSDSWRALTEEAADPETERSPLAGRASRARGRFTRNFVVQASAADWALVMLVCLRARLAATAPGAQLVFFQHDEVIVHCPAELGDVVTAAVAQAAADATRLVFGPTRVAFPMTTSVVGCYADAK